MNDKQGPYWNKGHPDHDKTVQQVLYFKGNVRWIILMMLN